MLKHMKSLEANPWFQGFAKSMMPQMQALWKIVNNGENNELLKDIQQTLD